MLSSFPPWPVSREPASSAATSSSQASSPRLLFLIAFPSLSIPAGWEAPPIGKEWLSRRFFTPRERFLICLYGWD